jgi:dihydrolipoamide dehydrogenase
VENVRRTGTSVKLTAALANGKTEEWKSKVAGGGGAQANTEKIGIEQTRIQQELKRLHQGGSVSATGSRALRYGDVVFGTPQLAHVATREGLIAVAHMAGKPTTPINRNRIPNATYTEPGIGSVGMTEAQARAQGLKIKVGKFPFGGNSRATILGHHEGFIKVVADEKFGEIRASISSARMLSN